MRCCSLCSGRRQCQRLWIQTLLVMPFDVTFPTSLCDIRSTRGSLMYPAFEWWLENGINLGNTSQEPFCKKVPLHDRPVRKPVPLKPSYLQVSKWKTPCKAPWTFANCTGARDEGDTSPSSQHRYFWARWGVAAGGRLSPEAAATHTQGFLFCPGMAVLAPPLPSCGLGGESGPSRVSSWCMGTMP